MPLARAAGFDEFYGASSIRVVRYAYALTGNLADAQDLTKEAFARAWQRWGSVSGCDSPEAWARQRVAAARPDRERQPPVRQARPQPVVPGAGTCPAIRRRLPAACRDRPGRRLGGRLPGRASARGWLVCVPPFGRDLLRRRAAVRAGLRPALRDHRLGGESGGLDGCCRGLADGHALRRESSAARGAARSHPALHGSSVRTWTLGRPAATQAQSLSWQDSDRLTYIPGSDATGGGLAGSGAVTLNVTAPGATASASSAWPTFTKARGSCNLVTGAWVRARYLALEYCASAGNVLVYTNPVTGQQLSSRVGLHGFGCPSSQLNPAPSGQEVLVPSCGLQPLPAGSQDRAAWPPP
jgi:hypothetical protein